MTRFSDSELIKTRILKTPWGYLWFAVSPNGLWRVDLPRPRLLDARRALQDELPNAAIDSTLWPDFAVALEKYFSGEAVRFDVTLDLEGITPFRRRVYQQLRKVPKGKVFTYRSLAAAAGSASAARGVGTAMATNPFPPVVPCHRVLGSDGSLRGFSASGGIPVKERLLEMDGIEFKNHAKVVFA